MHSAAAPAGVCVHAERMRGKAAAAAHHRADLAGPGDDRLRRTRMFTSFSQVCADIAGARVWSGIHFRFGDEQAAKIGRRVAHWGNRHAFR